MTEVRGERKWVRSIENSAADVREKETLAEALGAFSTRLFH